ncbi:MAG: lipocalin family protein, partial [Bacteroidales bacterium]|nr:lipocalin family protein [Bacteroidales bacterium]
VSKFVDSGVNVFCCGQQMQELIPSTNDSAKEKHLPVVECEKNGTIKVKVGSLPHPMMPEHHIAFIYLETEHGGQVKYLMPDQAPEAVFFECKDKPIAVYEYCNIHGLWKTDIKEPCIGKSCRGLMSMTLALLFCLASCFCRGQKVDNSTVNALNLNRYLGTWYEIARFDHSFERGLTHAKAQYALNSDGTISVTNSGVKKGKDKITTGKAKLTNTAGLLRVSFFGPFYSDYRVMMLSEDYNYALVGSGSSKYLWILSRTPDVPDDILQQILTVASDRGYDTGKLIWVDHSLVSGH